MQCHIVDAFLWVRVCVVSYLVSQVSSPVRGPHFSDHPQKHKLISESRGLRLRQ